MAETHSPVPPDEPAARQQAGPDTCPRCGGAFACGMGGAAPCPCTTVRLSDNTRVALRNRYSGCLCMRCLQAVAEAGG